MEPERPGVLGLGVAALTGLLAGASDLGDFLADGDLATRLGCCAGAASLGSGCEVAVGAPVKFIVAVALVADELMAGLG